jgi:quercetin dioxygenase-like cupin family protein
VQITRSSMDTVQGPADGFTGDVWIDAVAAAPAPSRVSANLVHFMPGARTHWHRHPLSQTVFVTEGDADHAVVQWLTPVTDEEYAAPAVD